MSDPTFPDGTLLLVQLLVRATQQVRGRFLADNFAGGGQLGDAD